MKHKFPFFCLTPRFYEEAIVECIPIVEPDAPSIVKRIYVIRVARYSKFLFMQMTDHLFYIGHSNQKSQDADCAAKFDNELVALHFANLYQVKQLNLES